jgi:hypothetical protein
MVLISFFKNSRVKNKKKKLNYKNLIMKNLFNKKMMYNVSSNQNLLWKNESTLNSCKVPHGLKNVQLDFFQTFRLLQESQFLQLNTLLVSVFILYNTIFAIVLDPEKNRVKVFLDHGILCKSLG